MGLAGPCPLGTRQRGASLGSWQGAGGGECRDAKTLAGPSEGARTGSWYWRKGPLGQGQWPSHVPDQPDSAGTSRAGAEFAEPKCRVRVCSVFTWVCQQARRLLLEPFHPPETNAAPHGGPCPAPPNAGPSPGNHESAVRLCRVAYSGHLLCMKSHGVCGCLTLLLGASPRGVPSVECPGPRSFLGLSTIPWCGWTTGRAGPLGALGTRLRGRAFEVLKDRVWERDAGLRAHRHHPRRRRVPSTQACKAVGASVSLSVREEARTGGEGPGSHGWEGRPRM